MADPQVYLQRKLPTMQKFEWYIDLRTNTRGHAPRSRISSFKTEITIYQQDVKLCSNEF
jgi:hypothetical protein